MDQRVDFRGIRDVGQTIEGNQKGPGTGRDRLLGLLFAIRQAITYCVMGSSTGMGACSITWKVSLFSPSPLAS